MVRDTSYATYHKIKQGKLLSTRRFEIYRTLYMCGPASANEIFARMKTKEKRNQANIGARLGELREQGVVKEVGKKQCKITGMYVISWDVTSKLPSDFVTKKKRSYWVLLNDQGEALQIFNRRVEALESTYPGKVIRVVEAKRPR